MNRVVCLISGGLDSAVAAHVARDRGAREVHALTVSYGQRHASEVEAARRAASRVGAVAHHVVPLPLPWGGSSLLGDGDIPKGRSGGEMAAGIPSTYVPARNTVFLALALSLAEAVGASAIYLGVNAVDYSGYPDCRPEFLAAFEDIAGLGTRAGIEGCPPRIVAPLVRMTKSQIVWLGVGLGVDFSETVSCYDATPDGRACGDCDSCRIRRDGFAAAGLPDPTRYATGVSA